MVSLIFKFFHVTHCVIGKTDLSQSKNKHKLIAISVAVEGRAGFMASSKLGLGSIRLWLYMLMRMGPDDASTFQTWLQTAKQFTEYSLENSWSKCWTFTVILEFQQSNPVSSVDTLAYNGVHQDMLGLIGVGLMGVHQDMLGLMGVGLMGVHQNMLGLIGVGLMGVHQVLLGLIGVGLMGVHQDMLGLIGVGLMGVHQDMLGLMGSAG